ncbi:MAG: hypothetical protein ACI9ND_000145 [Yoonia sp.]|jgi:hypothetical protein
MKVKQCKLLSLDDELTLLVAAICCGHLLNCPIINYLKSRKRNSKQR